MKRLVLTCLTGLALQLACGCADSVEPSGPATPDAGASADVQMEADTTESEPQRRTVAERRLADVLSVVTSQPDCENDCDHDGLDDCQEAQLGTAQCMRDSDRDGLEDGEEVELGTDPLDPDTDSDGADDGEEVELNLDPTRRSTFDDNTDDGMRWIVGACDEVSTEDVQYYTNQPGDWTFGLSPAFDDYRELALDGEFASDIHAAALYGDSTADIAGMLVSHPSSAESPSDSVERTMNRVLNILGIDEPAERSEVLRFETHDGFDAASQTFVVEAASPRSPQQLRESLIRLVLPPDVLATDLPDTADAVVSQFRLDVTYVHRPSEQATVQALMNVAIVPDHIHAQSRRVRRQISDATNTTNLARAEVGLRDGCKRHPANQRPKADFYWMVDQSRSMEDDYDAVLAFASRFFDVLASSGMDYRLGLATMDRSALGALTPDALWHTARATFIGELQEIQRDPYGADGQYHDDDEYGLKMAHAGLTYMLGLDGEVPQDDVRIRPDAEVVTLFVADEDPEAFQQYPLGTSAGQRLLDDYVSFFDQYSTVFALTTSDTWGYRQLAFETGGTYAPIHGDVSSTTRSIAAFITRTVADASTYRLPDTPVTASMRVFKNGRWVPRSLENGYAYFPRSNTIVFFGSFRPEPASEGGRGDFVAVHYETFTHPPKP